jgi:anti-anti-sigma factor
LLLEQEGAPMVGMDLRGTRWTGRRRVAGELDVAEAASVAAPAGRERAIIVDLAYMEFIDSGGMAALVLARSHARPAGGGLLLAAPHEQVMRLPPRTRLIDVS